MSFGTVLPPLPAVHRFQLAGLILASLACYGVLKLLYLMLWRPYRSPLKEVPGPQKFESYFWGNLHALFRGDPTATHEKLFDLYGSTVQYRGMLLGRRIATKDPAVVSHLLMHSYDFPKPESVRNNLSAISGEGLFLAEGATHRRQRRIMNACFGPGQIRSLLPVMWEKAYMMRDVLSDRTLDKEGGRVIDVLPLLASTALDIIGKAGFGYEFHSIEEGETNELAAAVVALFAPTQAFSWSAFLQSRFPILQIIPTEKMKKFKHSRRLLSEIGMKLVQEKKLTLTAENNTLKKKTFIDTDILTTLIKANMASDVKDSERLTDEEVMAQIATFLVAGHETSSTSTAWLLWELSKPENKNIQDKLRSEICSVATAEPTMEELNSLSYLDAVIKENLRVNPTAEGTIRAAERDCVIPVSRPYTDRNGVTRHEFGIEKGDQIWLPFIPINCDPSIWGVDARAFRPERWMGTEAQSRNTEIPTVVNGVMTFLGGARACIGYRMALLEMKVLVFVMLREFSVSETCPAPDVRRKMNIVVRPSMKQTDGTFKNMLPLIVQTAK